MKPSIFYEEVLSLTKKLVAIPSLNNSDGERKIAEYMAAWLRKLPYFHQHPNQVIVRNLKNDPWNRINVVAIAYGERSNSRDTIILHGHCDTVGIEDYGSIQEFAFDCDILPDKIKAITNDPEVLADIESGEWLFGRGASDMKCGDAINLVLIKYFTGHLKEFDGNIIFMTNPVEENQHTGIMEALDILEELKTSQNLIYKMAINNDFISPAYPGDTTRYFHAGAVGKILPCFYIIGKPTHSGQAFEGFSASRVAAEIVSQVDLCSDLCDVYNNEYTLPPTVLKIKDLKTSYNVQTAFSAYVYFNYFIHNKSMDEIFQRLKIVAHNALLSVLNFTNQQYKQFCQMTGMVYQELTYDTQVLEYSEIYHMAKAVDSNVDAVIRSITVENIQADTDRREIALKIVEALARIANINSPTVVIFLAPPYCPRNTLKSEIAEEKAILDSVTEFLAAIGKEVGENLKMMQFFPVLTDSSYLKLDDDQASIDKLITNFPDFKGIYNVPIEQIKRLNIPALNFGCFGKDAHKWTERVHKEYTLSKLPVIILKALQKYLIF